MRKTELDHLESIGPEAVLKQIASGQHGQPGSQLRGEVEAWLRSKQIAADSLASAKRDAREERTLAIAEEANLIAERALRSSERSSKRAIIAMILAAVATAIATVSAAIIGLIFSK